MHHNCLYLLFKIMSLLLRKNKFVRKILIYSFFFFQWRREGDAYLPKTSIHDFIIKYIYNFCIYSKVILSLTTYPAISVRFLYPYLHIRKKKVLIVVEQYMIWLSAGFRICSRLWFEYIQIQKTWKYDWYSHRASALQKRIMCCKNQSMMWMSANFMLIWPSNEK